MGLLTKLFSYASDKEYKLAQDLVASANAIFYSKNDDMDKIAEKIIHFMNNDK